MSDPETPNEDPVEKGKKKRELSNSTRKSVVLTLQSMVKDGRPKRGSFKKVGETFGVHPDTVGVIWKNFSHLGPNGQNLPAKFFSRRNQRGAKKLFLGDEELVETVKNVPVGKRRTLRGLASELKVSRGTAHRLVKSGFFRRHTCSLLPELTESIKVDRLAWCYNHVNPNDPQKRFYNMENVIHLDEKWFNQTEVTQKIYLVRDEEPPHRTSKKHKNHIPKIMFLAAMARPRYDPVTGTQWDGKVGIWELCDFEITRRNSVNRPAGVEVPKPYAIDHARYLELLVNKLLPAIKEKCPAAMLSRKIFIQHDNAPPHAALQRYSRVAVNDKSIELGIDVTIKPQPAKSPDLNVLDLGLFRALQCDNFKTECRNLMELIQTTKSTYDNYPARSIDNTFLTLQCVMNAIIEVDGGNNYKIPHISKRMLEARGELPRSIVCRALATEEEEEGSDELGPHFDSDSSESGEEEEV